MRDLTLRLPLCAAAALAAAARKGSSTVLTAAAAAACDFSVAPVKPPGRVSSRVHASSSSASGVAVVVAFASPASFPDCARARVRSFLASSAIAALISSTVFFLFGSGDCSCSLRHSGNASSFPDSTFVRYSTKHALASSLHSFVLAMDASSSRSSRSDGVLATRSFAGVSRWTRSSGSSESLTSSLTSSLASAAESNGGSAPSVDPSRRMSGGCKEPDAPLPSLSWPLSLFLEAPSPCSRPSSFRFTPSWLLSESLDST
mmetsp:Transcript_12269/g.33834  ORF Transcript_12269/g.33834 Transcript_12269/m.33834 type:complete len:260 (-) Transcript_12269:248-1027(-)